jgi:hypothetical protein
MKLVVQPGRLLLVGEKLTEVVLNQDARALGRLLKEKAEADERGIVVAPFENSDTEIYLRRSVAIQIADIVTQEEGGAYESRCEYEIFPMSSSTAE